MASLTQIKQRFWDNDGSLLAGGKVYVYLAGTSTLTNSYTDSTGGTPNASPVILDAKGEGTIWTQGTVKINVLNSANVQVTGYPVDYVGGTFADLAGSSTQTFKVAPATAGTMAPAASQMYATSILVNEYFQVNNGNAGVSYVSAAVLAAGTYGHEMWKAGAGGGDYSFTQNVATTTITIAAAKTLIQVVEDAKVASATYVLSWTGTAQARFAVNSATPAGAYAASPIYITGQTIGSTMSVEFNAGTLSEPALIEGTLPLKAVRKLYDQVLRECQRYYELIDFANMGVINQYSPASGNVYSSFSMATIKRIAPSYLLVSGSFTIAGVCTSATIDNQNTQYFRLAATTNAAGSYQAFGSAGCKLAFSARL